MIALRRVTERRHLRRHGQDAWRTFYPSDPVDHLAGGFGSLERLDEIRIPPGEHGTLQMSRESEIVTYVLEGALAQDDSTGRSGVVNACEFQHLTTGSRARHGERNPSHDLWAHVFRMSLRSSEPGLDCRSTQKLFPVAARKGVLCIVASPDGRSGSLRIHQDALIYSAVCEPGQHMVHELAGDRIAWLHVVRGEATLDDLVVAGGDGVGITAEIAVAFTPTEDTEILLLDLARPPGARRK